MAAKKAAPVAADVKPVEMTGVFLYQASKNARGTWKAILRAGDSVRYVKIAGTSEITSKEDALKKAEAKQFVW